MKVKITVVRTNTSVVDIGDLPINLIRDLLHKNDGSFDGNWSLWDIQPSPTETMNSLEVVEFTGK